MEQNLVFKRVAWKIDVRCEYSSVRPFEISCRTFSAEDSFASVSWRSFQTTGNQIFHLLRSIASESRFFCISSGQGKSTLLVLVWIIPPQGAVPLSRVQRLLGEASWVEFLASWLGSPATSRHKHGLTPSACRHCRKGRRKTPGVWKTPHFGSELGNTQGCRLRKSRMSCGPVGWSSLVDEGLTVDRFHVRPWMYRCEWKQACLWRNSFSVHLFIQQSLWRCSLSDATPEGQRWKGNVCTPVSLGLWMNFCHSHVEHGERFPYKPCLKGSRPSVCSVKGRWLWVWVPPLPGHTLNGLLTSLSPYF
jgi:hypothetical protein